MISVQTMYGWLHAAALHKRSKQLFAIVNDAKEASKSAKANVASHLCVLAFDPVVILAAALGEAFNLICVKVDIHALLAFFGVVAKAVKIKAIAVFAPNGSLGELHAKGVRVGYFLDFCCVVHCVVVVWVN